MMCDVKISPGGSTTARGDYSLRLGNHEFDNGVSGLVPFLNAVNSPVVAANLDVSKEPSLRTISKSVILEVKDRKIGIIGHLTPDTQIISEPGNVIFQDIVESIRGESEKLDEAGVQIIIVLGHSGFSADKEIAAKVPLVDVVIGGHTNTFLWTGVAPDREKPQDFYPTVVTQSSGKKVPVVQAYAYTKYLGRLNVTFNDKGNLIDFEGLPELLDTLIPQDEDVLELLETYRKQVDDLNKDVVGQSKVILDSSSDKCRFSECSFGNLITDAFVYYMASLSTGAGWNDYPIALINGGSIRNTIDPSVSGGNITRGELLGAIPFGSQVIALKINGSNLIKTLEIGARSTGETSRGEFLQVSGLHVVYNMSKAAGSRVVSVKVRCGWCKVPVYEPIVLYRVYQLSTSSFLANGGDGHYVLRDYSYDHIIQDLDDIDVVSWFIKSRSPIFPEVQNRIQFVDNLEKILKMEKSAGQKILVSCTILVATCLLSLFR